MMSCEQFRESIDCYLDGELSAKASAAADAHRRECRDCDRAVTSLLEMRTALKQTVAAVSVPPGLETQGDGVDEAALAPDDWPERIVHDPLAGHCACGDRRLACGFGDGHPAAG